MVRYNMLAPNESGLLHYKPNQKCPWKEHPPSEQSFKQYIVLHPMFKLRCNSDICWFMGTGAYSLVGWSGTQKTEEFENWWQEVLRKYMGRLLRMSTCMFTKRHPLQRRLSIIKRTRWHVLQMSTKTPSPATQGLLNGPVYKGAKWQRWRLCKGSAKGMFLITY